VRELARTLSADGAAFIHHSNLAAYRDPETGKLPFKVGGWRGESTSAAVFEQVCRDAGLICVGQELLRWREHEYWFRDCFSLLARTGSRFERENRVVENDGYWAQAAAMKAAAEQYGATGFPKLAERPADGDPFAVLRRVG
jgi:hypothetical protein